jgi:hypothetical protein
MRATPWLLVPILSSIYCCASYAAGGSLYLVQHLEMKRDGVWRSLGLTSIRIRRGSAARRRLIRGVELGSDSVAISTVNEWSGIRVVLTSSSHELVLDLDRSFLRSGDRKVTFFADASGSEYRITHFGERDCNDAEEVPPLRVIRSTKVERRVHAAVG